MDIERQLKAAQGRDAGPVKLCVVTVIGAKLNDVVQDVDCPPFVVHSIDPRNGIPTEEQRQACLKLWAENPQAPASYSFPEDGWPALPEKSDDPTTYTTTSEEDL